MIKENKKYSYQEQKIIKPKIDDILIAM